MKVKPIYIAITDDVKRLCDHLFEDSDKGTRAEFISELIIKEGIRSSASIVDKEKLRERMNMVATAKRSYFNRKKTILANKQRIMRKAIASREKGKNEFRNRVQYLHEMGYNQRQIAVRTESTTKKVSDTIKWLEKKNRI